MTRRLPLTLTLLLCAALAHAQPAMQPATAPSPLYSRGSIGQNLPGENDYSRTHLLIDVVKTSRPPTVETIDGVSGLRWTMITKGLPSDNGTYHWSHKGPATFKLTGGSPASIFNARYVPETDTFSADITVGAKPGQTAQLHLFFPGLKEPPKEPKLLRPGYASDAKTFTDEILSLIGKSNAGILRGMELLDTNGSTITTWADRVKPEDLTYAVPGRGAPFELVIDLCNAAGTDLWLNVPHGADDAFVKELARLCRSRLDRRLAVVPEYSNEVWNTAFSFNVQTTYVRDRAAAEGLKPREWYAKRTCEIADIFRAEFRGEEYRVRPVLSGQWANPDILDQSIRWIVANRGPLSDNVYAIAVAPYFGADAAMDAKTDATVETYLGGDPCWLWTAADTLLWHKKTRAFLDQAQTGHVVPMCYETALSLHSKSPGVVPAVNRDPRTGAIVAEFYRRWFEMGGGPACYFTICSEWTDAKCYGLVDGVLATGPKLDAVSAVSAAHLLPFVQNPLIEHIADLERQLRVREEENALFRADNEKLTVERVTVADKLKEISEGMRK